MRTSPPDRRRLLCLPAAPLGQAAGRLGCGCAAEEVVLRLSVTPLLTRAALCMAGLAALAAAPAAASPPAACPTPKPRVRVTLRDPAPPFSRDITVAGLHAKSGQPQTSFSHHLGLTMVRTEWQSELQAHVARTPDGGVCATVAEARITLANAEHRVLIAREIPEGGCLWREVETHERRHVAVNRRTLQDAATPARRALDAWAEAAVARAATPREAMLALRDGMGQAIAPVATALKEARQKAHGAIDTPEEYHRLYRSCGADQIRLQDRLRPR